MPRCRATCDTELPGRHASAMRRSFSSSLHRRRRSGSVMISTRPFIVLATSRMTMNSTSRTARTHARRPCRPCRRDTRSNPTPAGAVGQAMANGHQIATAGRIATNENVTRSFRSSLSTPTVCPADPVKSSGYAIKVIVVTIDAHANKVFAHEHRE